MYITYIFKIIICNLHVYVIMLRNQTFKSSHFDLYQEILANIMDITNSLTYHITRTGNLLRQVTAKRIKDAGINLTPEESVLMNQLWDRHPQTIGELGEWSVKDQSTISRQIEGLVKKGYVERFHSEEDRRSVLVDLSSEGRRLKQAFKKTGVPLLDSDMTGTLNQANCEKMLKLLNTIREEALAELSNK